MATRPDLYPGLVQLGDPGQLLAAVDVRVVGLGEGVLKLAELFLGEGRAVTSAGGGGTRAAAGGVALGRGCGGWSRQRRRGRGGPEGQGDRTGPLRLDLLEGSFLTCTQNTRPAIDTPSLV